MGLGLRPIVVVNKVDRPDARPDEVLTEVFDLLVDVGADDAALDFPVVYASAKQGWATRDLDNRGDSIRPVLEAIVAHVPAPEADADAPLQMLTTSIIYSEFVGRIAVGRVYAGEIRNRQRLSVIDRLGEATDQQVGQLLAFDGLDRKEAELVRAGDLCAVVGLDPINIGDTIAAPGAAALPPIEIDEPTLHMTFRVNDGRCRAVKGSTSPAGRSASGSRRSSVRTSPCGSSRARRASSFASPAAG